jgi:plastocyanin
VHHRIDPAPRLLPRLARSLAVLALGVAALTACGGGSSSSGSGNAAATTTSEAPASTGASHSPAQTLTATEADFSISLDKNTLPAGDYAITVVNNGRANHDLVVEQNGNDVARTDGKIAPGKSGTVTVTLEPGTYVFYCSVGNHRAMGMELTVQVT